MRIFLSGFMGCGKTSVGSELSVKTGIPFYDLDQLIEQYENREISEIFDIKGEEYFRKIETRLLKETLDNRTFVIALGGGTTLNPENLNLVLSNGILFYLHANIGILLERLSKKTGRPLIDSFENKIRRKESVNNLFKQREPIYAKAHHKVDVTNKTVHQVCLEILKKLK